MAEGIENASPGGASFEANVDGLPERLSRIMHMSWVKKQISAGWRPSPIRDDAARHDPNLVEFEHLTADRQRYWRGAAAETLALIKQSGCEVLPARDNRKSALVDADILQSMRFRDLVSLYVSNRDNWRRCPVNFLTLGEALLQRSEAVAAYEVFHAGIDAAEYAPVCDVPLRRRLLQRAAHALADAGALNESDRILAGLYAAGERDGETMGLWAKVHKRIAIDSADEHALGMALKLYREGYEAAEAVNNVDAAIYNGVNAATMARLAGKKQLSTAIVQRVRELCLCKPEPHYWDLASLGECSLLEGQIDVAIAHYRNAVEHAPLRDRLSMWQQALLISERIGITAYDLRAVFKPPSVLVFCGHRLDPEQAAVERFPPALEQSIRQQIRAHIENLAPGFGYCSAMCGSDILFIEEMLDYGAEVHVYLPFAAARFAEAYIAYAGNNWLERFQSAINRADSVTTVGEWDIGLNDRTHDFCALYTFGTAVLQHKNTRCELHGLTVWGGTHDTASGTTAVIDTWRQFGLSWECVNPSALTLPDTRVATESQLDDQRFTYLPMMFADVKGYSGLSGLQLYIFAQRFMTACADILKSHKAGIYSTRSQGDSLFVVFRDLGSAVATVRELRDKIADTDWAVSGLPSDLAARFALDCGPCYAYVDPVTGGREICGSHVIRAARLEPVTPPGHIYASESFAALCAVHRVEAQFEAAGSIILPKSYGQMRIYHLI